MLCIMQQVWDSCNMVRIGVMPRIMSQTSGGKQLRDIVNIIECFLVKGGTFRWMSFLVAVGGYHWPSLMVRERIAVARGQRDD